MKKIEVQVLDPWAILDAEKAMLAAARLTQRGHKISDMRDFMAVYNRPIDHELVGKLCDLPHVTLQKFGTVNVMVIGLSRRALAQLTRHQNEVKFMAGSLQYSDYSEKQNYITPPGLSPEQERAVRELYKMAGKTYDALIRDGCSPDQAGYVMPQGFRTSLLISATPYQWKHMINQRVCRRNTPEVRYIMLKIWDMLAGYAPELFGDCGPGCVQEGTCPEGKFYCGCAFYDLQHELEELKYEDKTDQIR